ncbi:UNVERIFIED_CONTAM: hypothetical protein PYX00_004737 [Menopon gallinae]|uniref:acetyl-CoA C-acyltransferase n=1 Tax=Menopon gallinae TaxID=328185 RepID=A0AAW2I696_9NEOP
MKIFVLGAVRALSAKAKSGPKTVADKTGKNVVFVDGVRTPFLQSGTDFLHLLPHELARHSLLSLLQKTEIPKHEVQYVMYGTVVQDPKTSNVAREASLCAGFPEGVPAHTVTQACISANQAITSAVGMISVGMADCIVCGGVEVLSNIPIGHSKRLRSLYFSWNKAKTFYQKLAVLSQIRPNFFIPDLPAIAEFSTGETMGHSADRLAAAFKVTREEQDEYALRSHTLAAEAQEKGYLNDIAPYMVPQTGKVIEKDNGIRVSTKERLAQLKPAFVKPYGSVTAANASFLTDGASACLIMSEAKAKALGLKPKAYLRSFVYKSQDPVDRLLLAPADCIASTLNSANLTLGDIDVWELHEAFAGQVLANLRAMESDYYCKSFIRLPGKIGQLDVSKLNNWGGSLSIGHPFAATGTRLCTHAANRMIREDGHLAIVAACAAGGQGVGMLMERHPDGKV